MSRRPPRTSTATLGRLCVMTNKAEEKARNEDELSLREELARLQAVVRLEKREEAQARQRLRQDELLNQEKDKELHDLLCSVKGASGVSLADLDQVREEFAVLLSVKEQCFEMRQTLDEKENCLVAMQEELRMAQVQELTREVADAKEEASRRAQEWEEYVNANESQLANLWQTARVQRSASAQLHDKLARAAKELAEVEELARRHEQGTSSVLKEVKALRRERESVEKDLATCNARLNERSNDETFRLLQESIKKNEDELEKLKEKVAAAERRRAENCGVAQIGVALPLLERSYSSSSSPSSSSKIFAPLKHSTDPNGPSSWLLHRLKQALAAGRLSGIDLFRQYDSRRDGRLSAKELGDAIRKMQIKGTSQSSLEQLIHDLDDSLMVDRRVSIVDLVLSLPLHRGPSGPSPEVLEKAMSGFVWACRRAGKTEGSVRQCFYKFIFTPSCDMMSEVLRLCCDELSMSKEVAATLAEGLELRREAFLCSLPSWIVLDPTSQGQLVLRFLRALAPHRRRLAGKLGISSIPLEAFRSICTDVLNDPAIAPAEIEEVALLSEGSAELTPPTAPPTVDGARLLRACQSGGFQNEFPELRSTLPARALQTLELAIEANATKEATGIGSAPPQTPSFEMESDALPPRPAPSPLPTDSILLQPLQPAQVEADATENQNSLPPLPSPSALGGAPPPMSPLLPPTQSSPFVPPSFGPTAHAEAPAQIAIPDSKLDQTGLPTPSTASTKLPSTTTLPMASDFSMLQAATALPTVSETTTLPAAATLPTATASATAPNDSSPVSPQGSEGRKGPETDYDEEDFDEEDEFEEDVDSAEESGSSDGS